MNLILILILDMQKKNNITGRKKIFKEEKCLLIKEAAEKILLASKIAKTF